MRIRMVHLIILRIAFLSLSLGNTSGDEISLSNKIQAAIQDRNTDLSWITSENQTQVIQQFKIEFQSTNDSYTRSYISNTLLALNDDETISGYINSYHAGDRGAGSVLELHGSDGIISYLAPDMFNGSSDGHWKGDVFTYSVKDSSSMMIADTICRSSAFPVETRAWVHNLRYSNLPTEQIITSLRQWWLHNKEAILEKRYQEATWLPPESGLPESKLSSFSASGAGTKASAPAINYINTAGQDSSTSIGWVVAVAIALALTTVAVGFLAFRLLRK